MLVEAVCRILCPKDVGTSTQPMATCPGQKAYRTVWRSLLHHWMQHQKLCEFALRSCCSRRLQMNALAILSQIWSVFNTLVRLSSGVGRSAVACKTRIALEVNGGLFGKCSVNVQSVPRYLANKCILK